LGVGLAGSAFLLEGAYAGPGALAFGISVAAIGIWIAIRRRPSKACGGCPEDSTWMRRLRHRLEPREGDGGELSAGAMGFLIGFVPCPPLIALLVFAATVGSAGTGMVLGLVFGLGTVISPMIVIAGAAGWFSDRIASDSPLFKQGVRRVAGLMLVALGIWTAYRAITAGGDLF
jgi:sulfite exporter TauE/SafE